ncbi:MAG: hypothetical protein HYX90_01750 [Chloroflexi bacterium]|nr:hypothetical protein [Chloroflexota bacterium]
MEMNPDIHELFAQDGLTEPELRATCLSVGQHLYLRARAKLALDSISPRAIEEFLVIFIMGGEGIRLRHVTGSASKHMIDVHGQPLSRYSFDLWKNRGLSDFRFLIDGSPAGESITSYYGNGANFGARIKYSVERTRIGTGGSLKEAILAGAIDRSFVAHYPDDLVINYPDFPLDFVRLAAAAMETGYQVIVVCVPGTVYPWGEVKEQGGEVTDFVEKPLVRIDSYTGICAISRAIFPAISQLDTTRGAVKLERSLFKEVARQRRMLKVLLPSEYWLPVNDWLSLRRFEQAIQSQDSGDLSRARS